MRIENHVSRNFLCVIILIAISASAASAQDNDPFAQAQGSQATVNDDPFGQTLADKAKPEPGIAAHWDAKHCRAKALLEQPTEYEFFETPLEEVIDYLTDKHHLEIYIDIRALEAVNTNASLPITQTMGDVSLRQALRLMLGRHGLAYVVREGIVIVTSAEEAEGTLITKTYSVRDLLHPEHPNESMQQLMDVMMACVAPDSWEQVGGPAAMRAYQGVLIVDQNDIIHQDLTQLLRELHADILAAGGPNIPVITAPQPSPTAGSNTSETP